MQKDNEIVMYTNWLKISERLAGRGIFSCADMKRILGVSQGALRMIIWRYTRKGALIKIRRGLYALKGSEPSAFYLANKIYSPSYVSFESALSYYHIIPETVYTVTSATARTTRNFSAMGREFSYRRIKKDAYGGFRPEKIAGDTVLIAEPEKAYADYLYFVFLRKSGMNDRADTRNLNLSEVRKYVRQFGNDRFLRWSKNAV